VNLAFEILNYRYANKSLTLISTEKTIDEIISLDDALGGRIYQMSKNYSMNIAYDRNKNYRLRR
jgi:DNA replication protein DnaC